MNFKKEIGLRAPGLNRGFFIALEGLDGAGKSTQARLLAGALSALGLRPLSVKEPGDGPWGRKIKALARAGRQGLSPGEELNYFVRDRAEDVAENIGPALLAGRPVLADRYILSNVAYQSALGLSEAVILNANRDFPWPDLIVVLELPVETGLGRIASGRAGGPDQAFEKRDFLEKVKAAFDRQSGPWLLRLDARDEPSAITARIIEELRGRGFIREKNARIVDSHCHLSLGGFERDQAEVIDRARQAGVTAMLEVGLGPESCRRVLDLAGREPDIHPVLGWHPHEADEFSQAGLRELLDLAKEPGVKGFGEVGLDFCLMRSSREKQLLAFESLLEAVGELDLPLVIHSRDAFKETYALLKKYVPTLKRGGVIHCFTLGWAEARAYLDLGFYLSLPGPLTFPKNTEMREAAALIPAEKMLVETDAPYLAPVPFRGRRNEPSYLVYHLAALAEIRGLDLAAAAELTSANAGRLFRLP
ncbi:MAG: dTMP kinase [Candidatus Adiutrix sp.]|jgi:TatD DNase family protein|nr:dTMP kinase [Candidatus Adiutrix sp.]